MTRFHGVADTLYIPLEARIYVSKRYPDFFYDAKALELEQHIPNRSVRKKSMEYAFVASVARYFVLDLWVREFCARHEQCNVVNLGVGLDTFAQRLDLPGARLYGVDLPHVIDVRRALLSDDSPETMIAADILDLSWTKHIDCSLPTVLLAAGVFQYFTHDTVVSFINALGDVFSEPEVLFDATNKSGLAIANFYVRITGNKSAEMGFYVDDPVALANECHATVVEQRPFFTEARSILGRRVKPHVRLFTGIADKRRSALLVHLRLT